MPPVEHTNKIEDDARNFTESTERKRATISLAFLRLHV